MTSASRAKRRCAGFSGGGVEIVGEELLSPLANKRAWSGRLEWLAQESESMTHGLTTTDHHAAAAREGGREVGE